MVSIFTTRILIMSVLVVTLETGCATPFQKSASDDFLDSGGSQEQVTSAHGSKFNMTEPGLPN